MVSLNENSLILIEILNDHDILNRKIPISGKTKMALISLIYYC